ncbi:unnamed protein product [Withania somnifera]
MSRPVLRFLLSTNSSSPPTAEAPSYVSVEPEYVVVIAALLCALICIIGIISIARCAWLRRAGGPSGDQSSPSIAVANKGLKKKVLQSLPTFSFDPSSTTGSGTECAICLAEYSQGDEIKVLPQCGHEFHVHCIDTWLGSHSSCPSCQEILIAGRCRNCGEFRGNSDLGFSST